MKQAGVLDGSFLVWEINGKDLSLLLQRGNAAAAC